MLKMQLFSWIMLIYISHVNIYHNSVFGYHNAIFIMYVSVFLTNFVIQYIIWMKSIKCCVEVLGSLLRIRQVKCSLNIIVKYPKNCWKSYLYSTLNNIKCGLRPSEALCIIFFGCYGVLLGTTGCYWVLRGTTGYYRVLQGTIQGTAGYNVYIINYKAMWFTFQSNYRRLCF